jgi:hypothetical protein
MTDTETKGEHDALAEGISRGLGLAADAALPQLDVEQTQLDVAQSAYSLVSSALERQKGTESPAPEVELLAEFVTIALAAGATSNHVDGWIADLCAKGAA